MKKLMLACSITALFFAACNSEKKTSQADTTAAAAVDSANKPVDSANAEKAWMEYMTPGEVHKMLATADGKWNAEMSMFMNPDSPTVSKLICENKMILGGRYQQSTFSGQVDKMPFEGIATTAYDNSRKIYISTWIDNMGTGLMYMEGTFDDATKTLTSKGTSIDPVTKKDVQFRETYKFVDNDHQEMEMFDTKDGKETKTMSIKLTRVK